MSSFLKRRKARFVKLLEDIDRQDVLRDRQPARR